MEEFNINLYHTYTNRKVSMAERRIADVKGRFERIFDEKHKPRWVDDIGAVENSINNTFHNSIKTTPSQVNDENSATIWQNLYDKVVRGYNDVPKPKFKIGQEVKLFLNILR